MEIDLDFGGEIEDQSRENFLKLYIMNLTKIK